MSSQQLIADEKHIIEHGSSIILGLLHEQLK